MPFEKSASTLELESGLSESHSVSCLLDICMHTIHSLCSFSVTLCLISTLSASGGFDAATVVIILHCFEEFGCLEFTSGFGDHIMFNNGAHPDAFFVLELALKLHAHLLI